MPITPTHAIVALPFVRTPLVPAAIAVGAMSPDFPLLVRALPLHYGLTHDFAWLPVTVVLALALLLVWRCLLRPSARELSPMWLARRLPPEWDAGPAASARETFAIRGDPARPSARGILLLIVSLALGIATHIVWDSFTHVDRWGVQLLPVLDEQWGPLVGFRWMQHGSSAVGVVILAVWTARWLRRREPRVVMRSLPDAVRWAWWWSLPVVLLIGWGIGLAVYGPLTGMWRVEHVAYRALPPAFAVWGVLTVVLAIFVRIRTRSDDTPLRGMPPSP